MRDHEWDEVFGPNKTHHIFYKTVNNINNKYYYGVHSTNDINDGYLGSGVDLKKEVERYGESNFTRHNLEFFKSAELAYAREEEFVTAEEIAKSECLNKALGGQGGYLGKSRRKEWPLVFVKGGRMRIIEQSAHLAWLLLTSKKATGRS